MILVSIRYINKGIEKSMVYITININIYKAKILYINVSKI